MMSEKNIIKLQNKLRRERTKYKKEMGLDSNDQISWKLNRDLWLMTGAEIDLINKILKEK